MKIFDDYPWLLTELVKEEDAYKEFLVTESVQWKCPVGHEYFSSLLDRREGQGCQYCSNHRVYPVTELERTASYSGGKPSTLRNDLWAVHPEIAIRLKAPELGFYLAKNSNMKAVFTCEFGHDFVAKSRHIPKECLKCTGKMLNNCHVISNVFQRASTEVANDLDLSVLTTQSSSYIEFICDKGHSYVQTVRLKFGKKSLNCQVCSGYPFIVEAAISGTGARFVTQEQKDSSYKNGIIDKQRNDIWATNPDVARFFLYPHLAFFKTIRTNEQIEFKCDNGHIFNSLPKFQTDGIKCPYCLNEVVSSDGSNSISTLFPNLVQYLEDSRIACLVTPSSSLTVNIKCKNEHKNQLQIRTFVKKYKEFGCPECMREVRTSKLEIEIFRFIRDEITPRVKLRDRSVLSGKEIDIYCEDLQIGLEVNGDYWHSDKVCKEVLGLTSEERHQIKLNMCKNKGVSIGFVWEYQWKNNKEEIKQSLKKMFLTGVIDPVLLKFSLPTDHHFGEDGAYYF